MPGSGVLSGDEVSRVGIEAYLYLYPLVTMEVTRRQLTTGPADEAGRGPMGTFHHIREFPAADFKVVVRPNFDTLYSTAWLDLSAEPMLVSAPASHGRYYLLPCYDMWTDAFASPGTRTSGADPIVFALTTPGWRGVLPAGVERIDAPTETVWIIGRTQTNGTSDYPAVRAFQDALSIVPLSAWGSSAPPPEESHDPTVDRGTPPLDQVNAMSGAEYFALAAELLKRYPPHATDWNQVARLRAVGIHPGRSFDLAAVDPVVRDALSSAPREALAQLAARFGQLAPVVNGWMDLRETMGVYGNHYVKRAAVALGGLGANQPEDAIYPVLQADAEGRPLDGEHDYVIHFEADDLPPVDAFWSVTMYDAQGFQAANELDRFAIGDRDDLAYNRDGSLDLFLQHTNPGAEREGNWLPAPTGPLGVTMRLYAPKEEVLSGEWVPPPVARVPR